MLRGAYQSGILTVLNSASTQPLALWKSAIADTADSNINIVADDEIRSSVVSLQSDDLCKTHITCPETSTLGMKLPYLIVVMKNTDQLVGFEVQVKDDRGQERSFWTANYEREPQIHPQLSILPLRLDRGWNHLTFDLAQMTNRAYGTRYIETVRIRFHANTRLRLVYFADRLIAEDELPSELKLYY
ncbi:hypothetical protein GGI25_000370 [Coemansia spiralis]|uniref:CFA20 domain-containing protein n=2 Tax=Coemansia TaxID=4863 RepID=A0A9W8GCH6_9FUNG|nr:Cilia/flagella-associated protein 20/WDR90/C3orf67 [Coemansia spiralis]KAJ1996307.1 hypothetical protein EDC05_000197 [Coemansia umbellata]KAJ2625936.1 hypothetical protein GGI26_000020 [Coemansia sp. RSA 1358]KAJ2680735.1 hypothetical protein GGI25_000370 [Coemansia spiralis]